MVDRATRAGRSLTEHRASSNRRTWVVGPVRAIDTPPPPPSAKAVATYVSWERVFDRRRGPDGPPVAPTQQDGTTDIFGSGPRTTTEPAMTSPQPHVVDVLLSQGPDHWVICGVSDSGSP